MMPLGWLQMDLEKSKSILKCLNLCGRDGSSSQVRVPHFCGLKTIAGKRRERGNSTLSLLFQLSLIFFCFWEAFSPSATGTWKWAFTLSQQWHRDRKLTAPKVVARLKISVRAEVLWPDGCLQLPFPMQWQTEQDWGEKLCLLCWQHG